MMKNVSKLMVIAAVSITLTGCSMFKELHQKYESQAEVPADAFGTSQDIR